jgi:hypothetical protein
MTRAEFDSWKTRYAPPFGMVSDVDEVMFDSWFDIFVHAGYTIAELDEARLALHLAPPKNRWEHLESIHRTVTQLRKDAERKRRAEIAPDGSEVGTCVDCGDTGWVTVPHPIHVTGGEWVGHGQYSYRPTAAVVCRCYRGRRVMDGYDGLQPKDRDRIARPMTLEQYQRSAPGWRGMLRRHEDEQVAAARAAQRSQDADKRLGSLKQAINGVIEDGRAASGLKVFQPRAGDVCAKP